MSEQQHNDPRNFVVRGYEERPAFGDEILELEREDRIVTQFVDDEIRVSCGNRTEDVTRRIVVSFNARDALVASVRELRGLLGKAEISTGNYQKIQPLARADAALALADSATDKPSRADLVDSLRELNDQVHSVLDGIEDGKDDDLESAYQRAFALLEAEDRRA